MLQKSKLLVVDDEEPNRDLLSRRLKKAGFDVELAASAQEALQVLEREEIDLILLDYMMPEMSGIDLLKILRATQSQSDLPVIMVTALSDSSRVVEALSSGANDYVTKPIDFPVALARVQTQLERRRQDRDLKVKAERLSLAASGANEGLFDWNLENDEIYVSESWRRISGIDEGETIDALLWLERLSEDGAREMRSNLNRWRYDNAPDQFENEELLRQADGSYRWLLVNGTIQKNRAGLGKRMVGSIRNITKSKTLDALTGFGNKTLLVNRLEKPTPGTWLLLLHLDRYKRVVDSLGAVVGDALLVRTAERIEALLAADCRTQGKSLPFIARLTDEQFAVVIEDCADKDAIETTASRLIAAIEPVVNIDGIALSTSANIGIAMAVGGGSATLLDAATALEQAKLAARGKVMQFEEKMRGNARGRMEFENDLRVALEQNQFVVYYQPKIKLAVGEVSGFEALVRWAHPTRGLVPPDLFIPIAEECGLMVPLGNWILREACKTMKAWRNEFPERTELEVSVNVSAYQMKDGGLASRVREVLAETGLEPHALQLEITESVFIFDKKETMRIFDELTAMGIKLHLDDFGTGYSSLQYLSALRFDALKIDKSFLKKLCEDEPAFDLVKSIIGMARDLSMMVVAEGIETEAQHAHLLALGCEYGQGYLFSKPVPGEAAREILLRPKIISHS